MSDALISCAAVALLVTILLAMDGRVREQASLRFATRPAAQMTEAGNQVKDLVSVVYDVVRDQSKEHTAMTVFVVAATVLFVFMIRT